MNKIVREHYPVEKLPEDLRTLVLGEEEVTVEITVKPKQRPLSGAETVALARQLQSLNSGQMRSMSDIVREVRDLRDEWDR